MNKFVVTYEKNLGIVTGSEYFQKLTNAYKYFKLKKNEGYQCTLKDLEVK